MPNTFSVAPLQARLTGSENRSGASRCGHTRVGAARAGRILVLAIAGLLAQASPSQAGVVIDFVESGSNVVATLSGSISDLSGATLAQSTSFSELNVIRSSSSRFMFSNSSGSNFFDAYTISAAPATFGTSTTTFFADSSTASTAMNVQSGTPQLWIKTGYVLNTPVTGTLTWNNKDFATMGLAQGSYVFGWTGDSITINVVPEPATLALAAVAGLGFCGYRLRRRQIRSRVRACHGRGGIVGR